nr:hypothetical protein [uncultured Flavobacterium sp.]
MKKLRFLKVFSLTLLASASVLLTSCEADTIDAKAVEATTVTGKTKPSKNNDLVLTITKQRIISGRLRVDYTIQNISDKKFANNNSKFSAKFVVKDFDGEPFKSTVVLNGLAAGKTIASYVMVDYCKGKKIDESTLTGEITDEDYAALPAIEKFNTCDFAFTITKKEVYGNRIKIFYSLKNNTNIGFVNSGSLYSANLIVKDSDGNIYNKVFSWDYIAGGTSVNSWITFECCEGRTFDASTAKGIVIYGEKSLDTSYSADVYKTCDLAVNIKKAEYKKDWVYINFSIQNIFNNSAINSGNFINYGNTFSVRFSIKDTNGKEYENILSFDAFGPAIYDGYIGIVYGTGATIVPETLTAKVIRNK